MTGQQLKNSILQMAVQGKLVPQDPNDEPAAVLLERIRKEKEQLIKDGKIKKEKNPSYIFRGADNLPYEKVGKNEPVCIADEVPFEIPESWEWVRISTIFTLQAGKNIKATDMFEHIFPERNKIKYIWIFHSLYRKFTLWRWQAMSKIGNLICQNLPLIQSTFNLMNKNISRPAILYRCIRIPDMLFRSFDLIHQSNIMIPCNLCKHLLHNFSIRKTGGKLCHILQVPDGIPLSLWKSYLNIIRKIINKFISPCFVFVNKRSNIII